MPNTLLRNHPLHPVNDSFMYFFSSRGPRVDRSVPVCNYVEIVNVVSRQFEHAVG